MSGVVSWLRRIRLKSVGTPFGGAGFEILPDRDKRGVEQFLSFLEGRRAMHQNLDAEFDGWVFDSMERIRGCADATLQELTRGSRIYDLVERFRDACVAFFQAVPPPITGPFEPMSPPYREALQTFRNEVGPVLGGLEGETGFQVRSGLTKLPRYFRGSPE
jgi:hypothetical protein